MSLGAGTRLGPYAIESSLGAGGMGEVYKARDLRLSRVVAIKTLSSTLVSDPVLRERFNREALAISRLSHPNVCALYDLGREGDLDYLVLEFLQGETLADRLRTRRLPLDALLRIANDIADGLAAAHRAGIVHRDLKPANVILAPTGAKLLDFGLAKPLRPPASLDGDAELPDTRTAALSMEGALVGTCYYMAPEQIESGVADERSDIWAFGCVLYEMATGRRPFSGNSTAAIVAAVLSSNPPAPSLLNPALPPAFDGVVAGCLERDPEWRWQKIVDVRRALKDVQAPETANPTRRFAKGALAVGALAGAAVLGAAATWRMTPHAAGAEILRFDIAPVAPSTIFLTTDVHPYMAVSPDGSAVAFVTTPGDGRGIWIKRLDAASPVQVSGTSDGESPFWSPDGRSLGFFAGGYLKRVTLDGSPPEVIARVSGIGFNGCWGPGDLILFSEWGSRRILRVAAGGGTPVLVRADASPVGWPQLLPDGRHFIFARLDLNTADVQSFVGSLDSTEVVPLNGVLSRAELAAGRLFFWRDGTLFAQRFDAATLKLEKDPLVVAEHVHGFALTGFAAFSVSPRTLLYQQGLVENRFQWIDPKGEIGAAFGPAADIVTMRLSPDGKQIAYSARDPALGTNDIFIYDVARDAARRLTADRGTENSPVWSPDGQTIVYAGNGGGPPSLFARAADGSDDPRPLVAPSPAGPQSPTSFADAGRTFIFTMTNVTTSLDIMRLSLNAGAKPAPLLHSAAAESQGHVSPDDRWLAYVSNASGRPEVYVQALAGGSGRQQVSTDGGTAPRWRTDGGELYYVNLDSRRVNAVSITGARLPELGHAHAVFTLADPMVDYDVAGDGRFLVVTSASATRTGTLSAVVNWPEALGSSR